MNIRFAIRVAFELARLGRDAPGYLHRIHVMTTNPKWSAL